MSDGPPSAPRATVLIACGDDGPELRDSAESALAQGAAVEVVVCAADEAAARRRLADRERIRIVPAAAPQRTLSGLFADAMRAVASPWVLFLPAGDRLGQECVARLLAAADDRSCEVVFARAAPHDDDTTSPPTCPADESERLAALVGGRAWPLATGLVRRTALVEIGGLDPGFTVRPEIDLWLRLVARGGVATADDAVVRVRRPQATATAAGAEAERGLAVARLVGSFAASWRPRLRTASPPARGEMRIELARLLLREAGPEAVVLAIQLLREARGLGVLVPAGAPFEEMRALTPGLCDEAAADPEVGATRFGEPAVLPSPAPRDAARGASRRLVVAIALGSEEERRASEALRARADELRRDHDVDLVALAPRADLASLDSWRDSGIGVEVLERPGAETADAELVLDSLGAHVVLAAPTSPVHRAAVARGLPCAAHRTLLPSEVEWDPAGLVRRLEEMACSVALEPSRAETARLGRALAREQSTERWLGRLEADLGPPLDGVERWWVRAGLGEDAARDLGALTPAADAVRSLAEQGRDLAERIEQKLQVRRRVRLATRSLLGRVRVPLPTPALVSARERVERFLARLQDRPETELWAIYTTDPYSELRGQRSTWIARELLARGRAIVFFYWRWHTSEAIAESSSPDLLPVAIDELAEVWPALAALGRPAARKVFLVEFPDRALFERIGLAKVGGFVTVYDCVDDWQEFARLGQALWYEGGVERFLACQCDVVLATHPLLQQKLLGLGSHRVALVPNGYDPASIRPRERSRPATQPERVVGYFGHLTDAWFDWELIRETALRRPDLRFEIIGYGEPPGLDLPANVRLLGPVPHERLGEHASDWDVAIVPFREGPLTRAVDPIKVYEYLAYGLPVVAVGMPALAGTPSVYPCERSGFEECLDVALRGPFAAGEVTAFLETSDWASRVGQILDRVTDAGSGDDPLEMLAG